MRGGCPNDLAPAALADGTLAVALPQRIAAVAGHLPSTVDVGMLPPLPPAVAEAAYNIASEAVANAVRHARATKVRVEVIAAAGQLRVSEHDDGGGIPTEASPGIGLASMRTRAAALGGTLKVASSPAGTTVALALPLETPAEELRTSPCAQSSPTTTPCTFTG